MTAAVRRASRLAWLLAPVISFGALALSLSADAQAQTSAAAKAAAETLFDEGKQLLQDGKLKEACPKFEHSQAIDPAVGTMLYLAECYERSGKTASAWASYREAASAAQELGQSDRADIARKRAAKLEPQLSRVTIVVAPGNKLDGFTLMQGDKPVDAALFNVPIPMDPGEHVIQASAPGHNSWQTTLKVAATAERQTLHIPPLQPVAVEPVAAPEPSPAPTPAPETERPLPPATAQDSSDGSGQRTLGVVVGGVGLVGIGVGAMFGLQAKDKDDEAAEFCEAERCFDERGQSASDDAQSAALIANISYGVGAAALIGGVILYLTAPDGADESAALNVAPALDEDTAGFNLWGTF